jgi:hypothetical protein
MVRRIPRFPQLTQGFFPNARLGVSKSAALFNPFPHRERIAEGIIERTAESHEIRGVPRNPRSDDKNEHYAQFWLHSYNPGLVWPFYASFSLPFELVCGTPNPFNHLTSLK